ncbi:UNVERIFIED_CONTAM: hypothetical protein GTU68_060723 [Idotea baltica]|nr:hypothetical protein [Idotea baltica]
MEVLKQISH